MRGKSMTRAGHSNLRRVVLATAVLGALVALAAGPARATTCDTWTGSPNGSWFTAGNWSSNSVPDSTTDACITGSSPVQIDGQSAQAHSLTLSGAELDIEGESGNPGVLTLGSDSSIGSGGLLQLFSNCSSSCPSGTAKLTITSGTLTNSGTIQPNLGSDGGVNDRVLNGDVTNTSTGSISVQAPLQYGAGAGGTL